MASKFKGNNHPGIIQSIWLTSGGFDPFTPMISKYNKTDFNKWIHDGNESGPYSSNMKKLCT